MKLLRIKEYVKNIKFRLNVKALVLAIAMLVFSYLFSNFSASMTAEPDIVQGMTRHKTNINRLINLEINSGDYTLISVNRDLL